MSTPARQPPGLPRGISFAAVLCLVLSGMTGMYAAMEASSLLNLSESKENTLRSVAGMGDPAVIERMESVVHAQTAALEPMREPRSLVLGSLAVTCAFAFVAAARMLRPAGLPREGMRRLLGGAAILAAILRVIDGAQWLVVVNRANAATVEAMILPLKDLKSPVADLMRELIPHIPPALALAHTFFIAGAFVVIGRYFHSDRVREAVTAQDGPAE
ncbi:MAG TPA: hypothetical protein VF815_01105 [Myxococcaceae bacterium]